MSSESSRSDNEELSTKEDTTTYSDFVDGNRKSDSKSTPLPFSLPLSKLMFQEKFMNSGNKLTELLKNKQSFAKKPDKKQSRLDQMKVTVSPNTLLVTKMKTRKEEVSESESEDFIPSSIRIKETLGTKIKKEINSTVTSSSKKTEEPSFSYVPLTAKVKKKKKEEDSKSQDSEVTIEMSPFCSLSKKTKKKKKEHITDSTSLSNEGMVNGKYKTKKSDSKRQAVKLKSNTRPVNTFVKQKHTESTYSRDLFETENKPRTNKTQIMRNFNHLHSKVNSNMLDNSRSELNNSDFERIFLNNKLQKSLQSNNKSEFATPKLPGHFKKLKSCYKGITKINEQHNLFNKIKSSDKMFLVRIPKKMKPTSLIGTKISLSKKTRVPEESRKYDCIPVKNLKKSPVAVFTNSAGSIHFVNSAGSINMQKHIKSKHIPDLSGMWDEKRIEFPERLKQRHPLFGSDFRGKIQLEKRIEDKLDAAIKSYTKGMKKKKKRKVVRNEQTEQEEEIFKFLNQGDALVQNDTDGEFSVKKMKKHKGKSVELEAEDSVIKHKKVTKHKKQVRDDNLGLELEISKCKKKRKYKTSDDS